MSRYQAWARFPDRHRVLVGWDECLCSYWVQVIDQEAWRRNAGREADLDHYMAGDPEWHRLIDELEDVILDDCGGQPYQLPTMAALVRVLKHYGGLEPGQIRLLIHDKQLSKPTGRLSRTLGRWFRRLVKTGRLRDRPAL